MAIQEDKANKTQCVFILNSLWLQDLLVEEASTQPP